MHSPLLWRLRRDAAPVASTELAAALHMERGALGATPRLLVGSDHHDLAGQSHFSHAMYSDDSGESWALSNSIAGGNECQVAALRLCEGRLSFCATSFWPYRDSPYKRSNKCSLMITRPSYRSPCCLTALRDMPRGPS